MRNKLNVLLVMVGILSVYGCGGVRTISSDPVASPMAGPPVVAAPVTLPAPAPLLVPVPIMTSVSTPTQLTIPTATPQPTPVPTPVPTPTPPPTFVKMIPLQTSLGNTKLGVFTGILRLRPNQLPIGILKGKIDGVTASPTSDGTPSVQTTTTEMDNSFPVYLMEISESAAILAVSVDEDLKAKVLRPNFASTPKTFNSTKEFCFKTVCTVSDPRGEIFTNRCTISPNAEPVCNASVICFAGVPDVAIPESEFLEKSKEAMRTCSCVNKGYPVYRSETVNETKTLSSLHLQITTDQRDFEIPRPLEQPLRLRLTESELEFQI